MEEPSEEAWKWCKERWELGTENGRPTGIWRAMTVDMGGPLADAENAIVGNEPYLCEFLFILPRYDRYGIKC